MTEVLTEVLTAISVSPAKSVVRQRQHFHHYDDHHRPAGSRARHEAIHERRGGH
ncbi:hypothetical protein ACFQ51_39380 [Streptomyces kaempferi]